MDRCQPIKFTIGECGCDFVRCKWSEWLCCDVFCMSALTAIQLQCVSSNRDRHFTHLSTTTAETQIQWILFSSSKLNLKKNRTSRYAINEGKRELWQNTCKNRTKKTSSSFVYKSNQLIHVLFVVISDDEFAFI